MKTLLKNLFTLKTGLYSLVVFLYACDTHNKDLGAGYQARIVTPTIQTIIYKPRSIWLIRGELKLNDLSQNFVCGYLSTRFFKEDGLDLFKGEYDKEGYFIVWKKKLKNADEAELISGLSKRDLIKFSNNNNQDYDDCI